MLLMGFFGVSLRLANQSYITNISYLAMVG